MCQTLQADVQLVRTALKTMHLPDAGTVWIGPYEQLHGAGYALLAAARHGVYERNLSNYHERVRTRVVQTILEHDEAGTVTDKFVFDNALAGFYFNSGVQRLVWASERLIKTFDSIPCLCKRAAEPDHKSRKFSDLLRAAKTREQHLISDDKVSFPAFSGMLNQFATYTRQSRYAPGNALAMLRYDVNNRKHAVFGPYAKDRKSAGDCNVAPNSWSDAPQNCQMHLACISFDVVRRAFDEVRDWQPNVKLN